VQGFLFLAMVIFCNNLFATLSFTNRLSTFVLANANAQVSLKPSTVSGWRDGSVVKKINNGGEGDYNITSYAGADKIITYAEAPEELTYNNSNAIVRLSVAERTDSNFINKFSPVIKGNSQLGIYLDRRVRTDSNAFARSIRNNSNAIYATDILAKNDSTFLQATKVFTGRDTWTGSGRYYYDGTLGSFTIKRSGTGFIRNAPITWSAPQTVTGLTQGATNYIYIDKQGLIGTTANPSFDIYSDKIILFECLYDSGSTATQITVREDHPYQMPTITSHYLHSVIGPVLGNVVGGANISKSSPGTRNINISSGESLYDHGLDLAITSSNYIVFDMMYKNLSGKWVQYRKTASFDALTSAGGSVNPLGSGFGIYTLYVSKDDLNNSSPRYFAVIDSGTYSNLSAANSALSTAIKADAELAKLELAQLGYVITRQSNNSIESVVIAKSTLKESITTGGTNVASLVSVITTNFNDVLHAADTNVQAALESVNSWGRTNSNYFAKLIRTNSNALMYSGRTNSNAIKTLDRLSKANSTFIVNNSNALVRLNSAERTDSNAIRTLDRLSKANSTFIVNNSNAILAIQTQVDPEVNRTNSNTIAYLSEHFVPINNGKLYVSGGIIGQTYLPGKTILNSPINLNGATLTNGGDILFSSQTTISTSGYLSPQGNAYILGSDLTIPQDVILTVTSSGIIDGQGNSLFIDNNAQIFVDSDITLTIRNAYLQYATNNPFFPPIKLASLGSKLTLENVHMDLSNDFRFSSGQLFAHNDVKFTGTSAFVYTSPAPSWIASGGHLTFDHNTTFSVAPATFTDEPFTIKNTFTSCNFIKMADKTSEICFNGCSLKTTATGLRIANGSVTFDNTNQCYSNASVDLASTTTSPLRYFTGTNVDSGSLSTAWSPDQKYIAVTSPSYLQIFGFNGTTILSQFGSNVSLSSGISAKWSPNNRFIAVSSAGSLKIYSFDGVNTPIFVTQNTSVENPHIAWSPNGKFISVVNTQTGYGLGQIFAFDGTTLTQIGSSFTTGTGTIRKIVWSSSGKHLAILSTSYSSPGGGLYAYAFDGTSTPTQIGTYAYVEGQDDSYFGNLDWSPDGRFIAVCMYISNPPTPQHIQVFSFDGIMEPVKVCYAGVNNGPNGITWSPDGRYVAATFPGGNIHLFAFTGTTLNSLAATNEVILESGIISPSWSPDGQYLACITQSSNVLRILRSNFIKAPDTQTASTGLSLGNSAYGPNSDVMLKLTNAARISIDGLFNYDNVNDNGIFTHRASSISLKNDLSKLILNPSSLNGWEYSSIVRNVTGVGEGDYNLKQYALADNIITYNEAPADISSTGGGSSSTIYTTHKILSAGQLVNGLVRFNDGFTILQDQFAIFDTCLSTSGIIDLQETGSLALRGNLRLDGNTTFTNSGTIYGKNTGLILDGDLILSPTQILHIAGNTFIDGNKHNIILEDNAQIFVDTNATMTLRNLTVRNKHNSKSLPPIRLASHGSKLALDNVTIAATDDFIFKQGQLFVHNDVFFTGTSSFIYASPIPSIITPNSRWIFDVGTTFSITPATFTDAPYTLKNTYTNCNFIRTADKTSMLVCNGCSLLTTATGSRLTRGSVLFDNNVKMISDTTLSITAPSQIGNNISAGDGPFGASWSADGKFILVTSQNDDTIHVFKYNNQSAPTEVCSTTITTDDQVQPATWSTDGKYIAVPITDNNTPNPPRVNFFRFNGRDTLVQCAGSITFDSSPRRITWSPDSHHIAVTTGGDELIIYDVTRINTPKRIASVATQNGPELASWSPDGAYIAVACSNDNSLQIFKFNGVNNLVQIGSNITTSDPTPWTARWSPDGRFIVVANSATGGGTGSIQVFRFNGEDTPSLVGTTSVGDLALDAQFSPDGRFIAVAHAHFTDPYDTLIIYRFNGTEAPVRKYWMPTGRGPINATWSPDGEAIAIPLFFDNQFTIFKTNYYASNKDVADTQALSNALIFGDSAKGADYDAHITLANASHLQLSGLLSYDNTSDQELFTHRATALVLNNANSKVYINPATLSGWKDGSIVKKITGQGEGDYNIASYTNAEKIIPYTGAATDLCYNNSNAILAIQTEVDPEVSRTNSNTIAYLSEHLIPVNNGKLYVSGGIIGQTYLPGKTILNSPISLNGATLTNGGDILFSSQTTISTSGYLSPQGNAYVLGGNLIIPQDVILTITSSGIIDGQGNTLFIDNNAQIFVDSDITLTIRNTYLHYAISNPLFPPIQLASHSSKLALENVTIDLSNDFRFSRGQFFVHNDVKMTGTAAFVYTSPIPSWIAAGSHLMFDHNTTLSVAPATFTDAPIEDSYVDCNFIKMVDRTSRLSMNGSTLMTTHTGLRLTKGTVIFDNTVKAMSASTNKLIGFGTAIDTSAGASNKISWSPDGRYLAMATNSGAFVYPFDGTSFGSSINTGYGAVITHTVAWSPNGRYLAVGGEWTLSAYHQARIYRFNGTSFTDIGGPYYNGNAYTISWAPSGKYFTVGGAGWSSSNYVNTYFFDDSSITLIDTISYNNSAHSVAWSPDGKHLAVGGTWNDFSGYSNAHIYYFDGSSSTAIGGAYYNATVNSVAWSPDGRYLAVGGEWTASAYHYTRIYRFDGTSITDITGMYYADKVRSVTWTPDGQYISVCGDYAVSSNYVSTYIFDGSSTLLVSTCHPNQSNYIAWYPNGKYLTSGGSSNTYAYPALFTPENSIQAMSNSIVFGNNAKGIDHDVDVILTGNALIKVNGLINYDCFNAENNEPVLPPPTP
jgi:Tol biopolymer transport system component